MYKLSVLIELKNGNQVLGVAKDTTYDDKKRECLLIKTDEGDTKIIQDQIKTMKAMTKNPHFDQVKFT